MPVGEQEMKFAISEEIFQSNIRRKRTLFDLAAGKIVRNLNLFVNKHTNFNLQIVNLPKPIRTKLLPYLTKLRCRNHRGSVEKIRTVLKGFKAMVTSNTKEIELDGLLTFCPFYKNKKKLTEVLRIIAKNAPNLVSLTINERNRLHECVIFHGKLGQDALEQISKLRGLKKLCIDSWHVNFFDLLELCKNLPALVHLEVHFENAEEQGGRSVFEVEDRFKESFGNLRVFLFAIHNPCPDEFTKFCIENLPKLEIVQARVDSQLYTTPISRDLILPCKSSSLRHLCTEPLDRPLHQLFPEVTHLKVFPLKDVILIPEIDALMNFSRIEYLCLSVIPTLAILNRLLDTYGTNLKGLELDEPQCSIKLETIFQKCPQLEKLIINCVEVEDADQPINNFSNLNELVWNTDYQQPAVLSNILSAPSLEKISLEGPYFDLKDLKKVAVLIAKKRILRHLTSFCHTVYEYQKAGYAAKLVLALSNLIKIASSAIPTLTDVKIGMNFKCVCTRKMKHVIHRYQYSTDHL